jgi:SAM-dependent methyltransferase
MFWFDRKDSRALFVDKRRERHVAADCSVKNGEREIVVNPDLVADFTALPFPDNQFYLVVFDPPHIQRNGDTSWLLKKYGVLRGNWREEIRLGFAECFRVLRPLGTLVFKWNEGEVSVPEILGLTPEKPLFGSRYGKHFKSHWIVFIKPVSA